MAGRRTKRTARAMRVAHPVADRCEPLHDRATTPEDLLQVFPVVLVGSEIQSAGGPPVQVGEVVFRAVALAALVKDMTADVLEERPRRRDCPRGILMSPLERREPVTLNPLLANPPEGLPRKFGRRALRSLEFLEKRPKTIPDEPIAITVSADGLQRRPEFFQTSVTSYEIRQQHFDPCIGEESSSETDVVARRGSAPSAPTTGATDALKGLNRLVDRQLRPVRECERPGQLRQTLGEAANIAANVAVRPPVVVAGSDRMGVIGSTVLNRENKVPYPALERAPVTSTSSFRESEQYRRRRAGHPIDSERNAPEARGPGAEGRRRQSERAGRARRPGLRCGCSSACRCTPG